MTERDTAPAQSPKQADDAFLAAVNALLLAMAYETMIEPSEADTLVSAMPDDEARENLRFALSAYGLV